jgi:hypothetical protein
MLLWAVVSQFYKLTSFGELLALVTSPSWQWTCMVLGILVPTYLLLAPGARSGKAASGTDTEAAAGSFGLRRSRSRYGMNRRPGEGWRKSGGAKI